MSRSNRANSTGNGSLWKQFLGNAKLVMGSNHSQLSNNDLQKLKRDTRFSEEELQTWYKGFLRDCPKG